MAHVEKRGPRKYRARYRGPDGKERSKTFVKRADAQRFLDEQSVAKARGQWVDPRAGRMPFAVWAEEVAARRELRDGTRVRNEVYMRRHVLPYFAEMPLAKIHRAEVRSWLGTVKAKNLSPATIKACYVLLSHALSEAVEERLIAQSPCRGIELPKVHRAKQRFLDAPAVERLADSIGKEYRALILSAAYLGCRWGELVGLRRENLQLLRRSVLIIGTLEEVNGRLRYVDDTKTDESRDTLTIPRFLVDELAAHLAQAPESEFVFIGRDGGFLRRSNFRRRHFKPAVERAELDSEFRFHDLRHTCAALLIEQGAHPEEVRARMRHASIRTTFDVYGHLLPSLGERLDEALDSARSDALAGITRPDRGLRGIG